MNGRLPTHQQRRIMCHQGERSPLLGRRNRNVVPCWRVHSPLRQTRQDVSSRSSPTTSQTLISRDMPTGRYGKIQFKDLTVQFL